MTFWVFMPIFCDDIYIWDTVTVVAMGWYCLRGKEDLERRARQKNEDGANGMLEYHQSRGGAWAQWQKRKWESLVQELLFLGQRASKEN